MTKALTFSEREGFQFVKKQHTHWRGSAHTFPRGEDAERSEADEECGRKSYGFTSVEALFRI